MATAIGKVSAIFTASTSGLTTGVNRAGQAMKKMEGDVRGLRSGLNMLTAIQGAQLFGQITAGISRAVSSFMSMAGAQAEVIDNTSKLAARLGFTYGELAGLGFAADLSGVSMDQLGAAITKSDLAFVKAANGSKQARAAFDRLGLSVDDLQGLSSSDRFDAIARSIAGIPNESERAAAAIAIFGKSGASLLPLFAGGVDAIAEARAEAERFGLNLTNMQGTNVEAMNDAFTRAQQAIQGVVGQIVAYLSPAVEAVTTAFSDFIGSVGGANIGQAIGEALLQGAQFFAGIADAVIANIGNIFEYAAAVGQSWFSAFGYGAQIASAFAAVGRLLSTVFLGIVRTALTPLMFIIEQAANLLSYVPGIGGAAEQVAAGVAGFRSGLDQSILNNASQAGENFNNALTGAAGAASEAAAGPLSTMLAEARARAQQAAAQRDTANRQTVGPQAGPAAVAIGPSTEALKATDSTSKEGIAEMFRIMRGDGGNVQQEQLGVLEQIRDAVQAGNEDGGFDATEMVFGGA